MSLIESLKNSWDAIVGGAETAEVATATAPESEPVSEWEVAPPAPSPGDRIGWARRELWFLRRANRRALEVATERVEQVKGGVANHENQLAQFEAAAAEARGPLGLAREQLENERSALAALSAMEAPTPQSMADEESVRRKVPRLEAKVAELMAAHEGFVSASMQAREAIERLKRELAAAEHSVDAWQLGVDASESFMNFRIRGLEHIRRGSDTLVGRTLGVGNDDSHLGDFVRMHKEYVTQAMKRAKT